MAIPRWTRECLKTTCIVCAMILLTPTTILLLAGWTGFASLSEPTREIVIFLQLTGMLYLVIAALLDAKPIIMWPWWGWAWRLFPLAVFGVVWIAKAVEILGWVDGF